MTDEINLLPENEPSFADRYLVIILGGTVFSRHMGGRCVTRLGNMYSYCLNIHMVFHSSLLWSFCIKLTSFMALVVVLCPIFIQI